jgi:hypothetical protein
MVLTNTNCGWYSAEDYSPFQSRCFMGRAKPLSDNNYDDKHGDVVKDEKKQNARKVIEEWSKEQERRP